MNRAEAINLIKEITDEKCTNLVGHDIILILPNANDNLSQGHQLQIKTVLDSGSLRCLEVIVKHNGYALKNEPEKKLIVIYSPKDSQNLSNEETGIM